MHGFLGSHIQGDVATMYLFAMSNFSTCIKRNLTDAVSHLSSSLCNILRIHMVGTAKRGNTETYQSNITNQVENARM